MSSSLEAWFNTRPLSAPAASLPIPPTNVVAIARARDGSAELRIVRRSDGLLTFEIEAWTNFEDAGGQPHLQWHTFHPAMTTLSDSYETIVEEALADAMTRRLELTSFELITHASVG
jgi:hypothetical protein